MIRTHIIFLAFVEFSTLCFWLGLWSILEKSGFTDNYIYSTILTIIGLLLFIFFTILSIKMEKKEQILQEEKIENLIKRCMKEYSKGKYVTQRP